MKNKQIRIALIRSTFAIFLSFLATGNIFAQTKPLEQFSWLIGGKWTTESGTYHTFEWGLNKGSIVARTYAKQGEKHVLASQGMWFWHPEEKAIKGIFIAGDQPSHLMEFTTEFEAGTMHNNLKAFDKDGNAVQYTSTWTPNKDRSGYLWQLFSGVGNQKKEVMKGNFTRK